MREKRIWILIIVALASVALVVGAWLYYLYGDGVHALLKIEHNVEGVFDGFLLGELVTPIVVTLVAFGNLVIALFMAVYWRRPQIGSG